MHNIRSTEGKGHQKDTHGLGGRLTRKQTTSRPDDVWPDVEIHVRCREKEKQKWAIEKPKLDNARHLRGRFSIEPNDEPFKRTMTAARGKLEVPMPAAMPCKIPIKSSGQDTTQLGNARQNTLVLSMPTKARDQG